MINLTFVGRAMIEEQVILPVDAGYKIPHILKYMGSKREILDFVTDAITNMDARAEWVCDLFAGTSVVAGALKDKFNVHANDIQEYSSILSHTYLSDLKSTVPSSALSTIIEKTDKLVKEFKKTHPELSFNYDQTLTLDEFIKLEKAQQELIHYNFKVGFHQFVKNFSGTYWSYDQCVWIDAFRAVAESYTGRPEYYAILSSLIFAMSYASQSTGHYAQYRDVTASNMSDILSYRTRDVKPYFERKFIELTLLLNGTASRQYRITTLDYMDCLRIMDEGAIVYADPPYQSVHYSRFYHALETLVKYDNPKAEHKGRYRDDRHQSPFCLRTKVDGAFVSLFEGVKNRNSHLALSYSDTGLISKARILALAKQVFGSKYKTDILTKSHMHSNMGRKFEKEQEVEEFIITVTRR